MAAQDGPRRCVSAREQWLHNTGRGGASQHGSNGCTTRAAAVRLNTGAMAAQHGPRRCVSTREQWLHNTGRGGEQWLHNTGRGGASVLGAVSWFLLWGTFIQNWRGRTHVYVAEVNDWRQKLTQSCSNTLPGRGQLPTTAAREMDCSLTQLKWRQFCVENGGLLEIVFVCDQSFYYRLSVSDWFCHLMGHCYVHFAFVFRLPMTSRVLSNRTRTRVNPCVPTCRRVNPRVRAWTRVWPHNLCLKNIIRRKFR